MQGCTPNPTQYLILNSSSSNLQVPSEVKIPGGLYSPIPIDVTTTPVSVSTPITVTGSFEDQTFSCTILLLPAQVQSLLLDSEEVVGGSSVKGTVLLSGKVAKSGTVLHLSCSPSGLISPQDVTLTAEATQVPITITTAKVAKTTLVTIKAYTWSGDSLGATTTLQLDP
jgi:hypothetical protein